MLAPVVLVFIAAADAGSPATASLVEAVTGALGEGARVVVQANAGSPPTDDALEAAARARGASAAARLVWGGARRTRVALDVYLVASDRTVHRVLDFEPEDEPVERARAVGLVLASLLQNDEEGRPPSTRAPPPPAPEPPPQPPATPPPPAGAPSDVTTPAAVPAPASTGPWALDGFVDGGRAFGGAGAGIGGGLAARLQLQPTWGGRLGLHARGGSVAVAQASSLAVALSAGGFRRLLESRGPRSWELAARTELMLMYEALTHFSSDDPAPVRRGRFLPGAAVLLEGQWRVSTSAALHLAVGLEAAFGVTRVVVRGNEVAQLAPIRGVLEVGFRARF